MLQIELLSAAKWKVFRLSVIVQLSLNTMHLSLSTWLQAVVFDLFCACKFPTSLHISATSNYFWNKQFLDISDKTFHCAEFLKWNHKQKPQ